MEIFTKKIACAKGIVMVNIICVVDGQRSGYDHREFARWERTNLEKVREDSLVQQIP